MKKKSILQMLFFLGGADAVVDIHMNFPNAKFIF